jgi:hypothetical protein
MKTLTFVSTLALAALSGLVVASAPSMADGSGAFNYTPVPHYQPFRGYYGAQTYIGQTYRPSGGGTYVAPSGGGYAAPARRLRDLDDDDLDCEIKIKIRHGRVRQKIDCD